MRLILGSQSPRRKEILGFFSIPFEQFSPYFAEELVPYENNPISYAKTLAKGKAGSLVKKLPNALILAADTIVIKEGKLFNKPENEEEAFQMLSQLNGAWHSVFTAVSAQTEHKEVTLCEETRVLFHQLSKEEIEKYHKTFKSTDKAGGYGIQMGGSIIVKRMEGCFYNVMGLPISATVQALREFGIDLWHYLK